MFKFRRLITENNCLFFENKIYNTPAKYTKKYFGQSLANYIGPTYINLMTNQF